jgi:hypothetical protein
MTNPPENLCLGHGIAYVLLFAAKYNDGASSQSEFEYIHRIMKYWMGNDSTEQEIKAILIETDEWFTSGTNYERAHMLDKVIDLIKSGIGDNHSVLLELFEDCVRLTASNRDKYNKLSKGSEVNNLVLLELYKDYPLLATLESKLKP